MMSEHEDIETVEAPALVVPPKAEQEKAARGAQRWAWISRTVGVVIVLGILGFGAYLAAANAGGRVERLELIEQLDEAHVENAELRDKVDALYEQVLAAGENPVVEPETSNPPASVTTPGEKGETGPPGRPPTVAEIVAAFNAYCAANNGCRGGVGPAGAPGAPGESIVGPQGELGPVGPQGPQGEQGEPGAPGASGISVIDIYCVAVDPVATAFRFTFSDGSTIDVAGPCIPAA